MHQVVPEAWEDEINRVAVGIQAARAVLQNHFWRALDQSQRPVAGDLSGGKLAGAVEGNEIDDVHIVGLRQVRRDKAEQRLFGAVGADHSGIVRIAGVDHRAGVVAQGKPGGMQYSG